MPEAEKLALSIVPPGLPPGADVARASRQMRQYPSIIPGNVHRRGSRSLQPGLPPRWDLLRVDGRRGAIYSTARSPIAAAIAVVQGASRIGPSSADSATGSRIVSSIR